MSNEPNIVDRILDAALEAGAERLAISANHIPGMKAPGKQASIIPGFEEIITGPMLYPSIQKIIKENYRSDLGSGVGSHQFNYSRPGGTFRVYTNHLGSFSKFVRLAD